MTRDLPSLQLSQRVTIRPGDVVQLRGGGDFHRHAGAWHRIFHATGTARVIRLHADRSRVFADLVMSQDSQTRTLLIQGEYRSRTTGLKYRAYSLRRAKP